MSDSHITYFDIVCQNNGSSCYKLWIFVSSLNYQYVFIAFDNLRLFKSLFCLEDIKLSVFQKWFVSKRWNQNM